MLKVYNAPRQGLTKFLPYRNVSAWQLGGNTCWTGLGKQFRPKSEKQHSDPGLHCLPFHLHLLHALSMAKTSSLIFKLITAIFPKSVSFCFSFH